MSKTTSPKPAAPQAATYVERTEIRVHSAMAQTIAANEKKFDSGITKIVAGATQMVDGVNAVFDAGRGFADERDLNQFEFRQWHDNAADWKEDAIRREKMKCAIKVYEAMKPTGRAKKLADCPKAVQIILRYAQPPEKSVKQVTNGGGEDSGGEEKNWWAKLTSVASDFETTILKICGDGTHPIDAMEAEELDKLVRATEPVVKVHETAKQRLAKIEA